MAPSQDTAVSLRKPEARPPKAVPDLYGLLGISSPNATEAEIQKVFAAIVEEHQPESPNNAVISAFIVLSSAVKRAQYDRDRLTYLQSISAYDEFLAATSSNDSVTKVGTTTTATNDDKEGSNEHQVQQYSALLEARIPDPREEKIAKAKARLGQVRKDHDEFEQAANPVVAPWAVSQNQTMRMGANSLRAVLKCAHDDIETLEKELSILQSELPPEDTGGAVGRVASGQYGSENDILLHNEHRLQYASSLVEPSSSSLVEAAEAPEQSEQQPQPNSEVRAATTTATTTAVGSEASDTEPLGGSGQPPAEKSPLLSRMSPAAFQARYRVRDVDPRDPASQANLWTQQPRLVWATAPDQPRDYAARRTLTVDANGSPHRTRGSTAAAAIQHPGGGDAEPRQRPPVKRHAARRKAKLDPNIPFEPVDDSSEDDDDYYLHRPEIPDFPTASSGKTLERAVWERAVRAGKAGIQKQARKEAEEAAPKLELDAATQQQIKDLNLNDEDVEAARILVSLSQSGTTTTTKPATAAAAPVAPAEAQQHAPTGITAAEQAKAVMRAAFGGTNPKPLSYYTSQHPVDGGLRRPRGYRGHAYYSRDVATGKPLPRAKPFVLARAAAAAAAASPGEPATDEDEDEEDTGMFAAMRRHQAAHNGRTDPPSLPPSPPGGLAAARVQHEAKKRAYAEKQQALWGTVFGKKAYTLEDPFVESPPRSARPGGTSPFN